MNPEQIPQPNTPDTSPTPKPISSAAPVEPATPQPIGPVSPQTVAAEPDMMPPASSVGQIIVPSSESTPTDSSPVIEPLTPRHHRGRWLILLLIVLLAAGGAAYALHRHKQPVVSKHDIPLVRYGMVSGTTLSAAYPNTPDTNTSVQVESQLFEGLVAYANQSEIKPLLATGWTNPDSTHWVFTLRSGIHFHSGRPVTTQAVASSLNYAVAHQKDKNGTLLTVLSSTIKTATAEGTNKVVITTDGPDPTLLNRLTSLYIFDQQAPVGSANAGTGPYTQVASSTTQSNTITFKAATNYWGGHVYTRSIVFSEVSDTTKAASQAAAGKYDVTGEVAPTQQVKTAGNLQIKSVENLGPYFIGTNTLKPSSPLFSLAARQAVAAALNVPAITKAANSDGQPASQLIPPAIPGHDPSLHTTQYDLAKAKQLLSGVPNAKTPITFAYPAPDAAAINEIIRQLTAAGFVIKPQPIDDLNTLVGTALSGKVDMYYLNYTSDTLDGLDILSTLLTGNADYDNPQIDKLAQQASSTLDPSTRIQELQQISQQAAKDLPDIPVYTSVSDYAVRTGYHLNVDMPNAGIGAYFWKVYQ